MPSPYEHRTVRSIDDDIARQRIKDEHARQRAERRYDIDRQRIDRIAELEAQVRWLRDYAINETIRARQTTHGGPLRSEHIRSIIGAIDGNMAVAADRAKGNADDHD